MRARSDEGPSDAVRACGLEPVPRRSFDALFRYGLQASSPALAEGLRALGYTPQAPREHFALDTWRQALELARQQVYGPLQPAQGYRLLGHRFVEGFHFTLLGGVFLASAARLGPERVLLRLPTFLRATRAGMTLAVHARGPAAWLLDVTDPHPLPDFVAGVVERTLQVAGSVARVEVGRRERQAYQLTVDW